MRPSYAIYEPGFTRTGAALARAHPGLQQPVYRFMFSDQFAFGFPPRAAHLNAHLALLREIAPAAPWMIAGLGVDLRALIPIAIEQGGHVRVGLEDWPLGARTTNVALVEEAARRIAAAGGQLATAAEVRTACAAADLAVASPKA